MNRLKVLSAVTLGAIILIGFSCGSKAQQAELPKSYITIGYEGTPVKEGASATAKSIAEAVYGEIFEVTGTPEGAYVKARNIATGTEGWLDTMKINHAAYPLLAPEVLDEEPDEPFLLNIENSTMENGTECESTSGWTFWRQGGKVVALNSTTTAYSTGRVNTWQNYYTGEEKEGYLLLTEQVEYGDTTGQKLDTPIIIWEDIAGRAGIFEGGKCFTPGGQLYVGDSDEWEE